MIQEIDNFFPEEIQDNLLKIVSSTRFPWYFVPVPNLSKHSYIQTICNNDPNIVLKPGFQHLFYIRNEVDCETVINDINLVDLLVDFTEKKFNIKVNTPMRILGLLALPDKSYGPDSYLLPHVDYFFNHKTCLYYINDSDGDTFLFKEKSMIGHNSNLNATKLLERSNNFGKKTLNMRVSPKKGKAILFNGLNYHSGSIPRQNLRYVLNFNFL